jgi:hypothetical protein
VGGESGSECEWGAVIYRRAELDIDRNWGHVMSTRITRGSGQDAIRAE